jgi:hypothetical protein
LQTAAAAAQEKKVKEGKGKDKKKRKSRKSDIKKGHEDECYRCGEGGELIMCDKNGCPKVYHLNCLKLSKPPHGKYTISPEAKCPKELFPSLDVHGLFNFLHFHLLKNQWTTLDKILNDRQYTVYINNGTFAMYIDITRFFGNK